MLVLKKAMKKSPKIIRSVKNNKHPIIMNPKFGENFEGYKQLGKEKLSIRAKVIRENKEFAEKISQILQEEVEEKEQPLEAKQAESIYTKFTGPEDNKIMPEFHSAD